MSWVETTKGLCYLVDTVNVSGGCEAAVTARARVGWMKFRECGELLRGRRFPLKIKGKFFESCVRPALLYGSETWRLRVNEMAILRRTERSTGRAMCGVKLMDRTITEELMGMLGLPHTVDMLARANGVHWYGHILRRDDDRVLRRALDFKVTGRRGRP